MYSVKQRIKVVPFERPSVWDRLLSESPWRSGSFLTFVKYEGVTPFLKFELHCDHNKPELEDILTKYPLREKEVPVAFMTPSMGCTVPYRTGRRSGMSLGMGVAYHLSFQPRYWEVGDVIVEDGQEWLVVEAEDFRQPRLAKPPVKDSPAPSTPSKKQIAYERSHAAIQAARREQRHGRPQRSAFTGRGDRQGARRAR